MQIKEITVNLSGTQLGLKIFRTWLMCTGEIIAATGTDYDDHEIWLLDLVNKTITLIGALSFEAYRKSRRVRCLNIDCNWIIFNFLNKKFFKKNLSGHVEPVELSAFYTCNDDATGTLPSDYGVQC